MKRIGFTQRLVDSLLSIIFPNVCLGCTRVLFDYEREICTICINNLPKFSLISNSHKELAQKFVFESKIDNVRSFIIYKPKGIGQKLIHALKYKYNQEIGLILGELFAEELFTLNFQKKYDIVIPVPLHKRKLALRGYNQSEIIANPIAQKLNLPHIPDGLVRTAFTNTQTQKSKIDRWANMDNPFKPNSLIDLNKRRILLVDDVVTTGATISAAVDALVLAGVSSIGVVSIAAPKK
jgi:ComF family protein